MPGEEGRVTTDEAKKNVSSPYVVRTPADAVALARRFEREGRRGEAEQLYRKTLEKEPENVDALRGLGLIAHHAGKNEDARHWLRRAVEICPTDANLRNDLGGVLGALGQTELAIAEFREAVRIKPNHAEVLGNLGIALQRLGKIDEAIDLLRQSVLAKPESVAVHTQLGAALAKLERHEEAVAAFQAALAVKPSHAEAHGRLGNSLRMMQKTEEALLSLRSAIKLKPNYPEAHVNIGLAYLDLNRATESVAAFATAIRLKPDYAEAHWNHGLALLLAGDWVHGWPEYEWRRPLRDDARKRRDAPVPMWDGSDPANKTVLLHAEQGFGDAIMFARFASALAERGATVVMQVRPELIQLISTVPGVAKVVSPNEPMPPLDFHAHLMSLPAILGTTFDSIPGPVPFLRPPAQLLTVWRDRLAEDQAGLKVGIAWGCNPKPLPTRACPLSNWTPLGGIDGVSFYVLQKGEPAQQLADAPSTLRLTDYSEHLTDFAQTAALIANLDLVITVDTSVAHVAGALGKPTWILLPWVSDWRWMLGREDTPWYPTAKLYRQVEAGNWGEVLGRVSHDLKAMLGMTEISPPQWVDLSYPLAAALERLATLEAAVDVDPTISHPTLELQTLRKALQALVTTGESPKLILSDELVKRFNDLVQAMKTQFLVEKELRQCDAGEFNRIVHRWRETELIKVDASNALASTLRQTVGSS